MHDLFNASGNDGSGNGRWKQCRNCGATKHSGYWWLAGYKSKVEAPCFQYPSQQHAFDEWKKKAIDLFNEY